MSSLNPTKSTKLMFQQNPIWQNFNDTQKTKKSLAHFLNRANDTKHSSKSIDNAKVEKINRTVIIPIRKEKVFDWNSVQND